MGKTDTLNFDDELKVNSLFYFLSAQMDVTQRLVLTAGISFNSLKYDINRLFAADGYGTTERVKKDFNLQVIPRAGFAYRATDLITIHGSVSYGFSPPTIEEVRTNEGSINLDLEPEKGTNFELGTRGTILKGALQFDLVAFRFLLDESIVQQESSRGTVLFRNAGSTTQNGFEANLSYLLFEDRNSFLKRTEFKTAYTYSNFTFDNYQTKDGDFSGNDLTGIAPHTLISSVSVETNVGVYATLSHNYTDAVPLNDENTVYSNDFHLVQSVLGVKATVLERLSLDLSYGLDNILDESYSLGYDINAFGNRYFQPAPERNWFVKLSMKYRL
jgi:iron complex outermembrane receptor protein